MPRVNLGQKLKNLAGSVMKDSEGKDLTLGWAVKHSLLTATDTQDQVEKMVRYKYAESLTKSGLSSTVSMKSEDISRIKKCAGFALPTEAMGVVCDILEGEYEDPDPIAEPELAKPKALPVESASTEAVTDEPG